MSIQQLSELYPFLENIRSEDFDNSKWESNTSKDGIFYANKEHGWVIWAQHFELAKSLAVVPPHPLDLTGDEASTALLEVITKVIKPSR